MNVGGGGELEVSVVSNEESRAALKRRVEDLVCGCAALYVRGGVVWLEYSRMTYCICFCALAAWSSHLSHSLSLPHSLTLCLPSLLPLGFSGSIASQ